MQAIQKCLFILFGGVAAASAAAAALPNPGMDVVAGRTALVITDPQNDFLSPQGVTWASSERASPRTTPLRTSTPCSRQQRPMPSRSLFRRTTTTPTITVLVLQLRKRGIDKIILAGMSANLCTESHLRELIEQGFEVAMVTDATAAAQVEEGTAMRPLS